MADDPMPAPTPDTNKEAHPSKENRAAARKGMKEQQKHELPTNDWPGKGAA